MILTRAFWLAVLTFFFGVFEAQAYCVSKAGARLRRAPTGRSEITWRVPKYMPLSATGKRQSGWVEVRDVDNQIHWAQESDLTGQWSCAVVSTKTTRLRLGPGKHFQPSPLGVTDKYSTFLDLGGEDGWTQVENDEGDKAWANLDHLWKPTRKTRMSFDQ